MGNFGRDKRGGDRGGRGGFGRRDFGGRGRGFGGGFNRGSERRELFSAVCSNCGKECKVPFRPSGEKPVYCSECFEKMNGGREDSRRPGRSEFRSSAPAFDQNNAQFDAINVKLDKILSILAPAPIVKEENVKKVEIEKPEKKVKKAASKKE